MVCKFTPGTGRVGREEREVGRRIERARKADRNWDLLWISWVNFSRNIPPLKFNKSHLKVDGWKMTFPFKMVPLQVTFIHFRGCNSFLHQKIDGLNTTFYWEGLFSGAMLVLGRVYPLHPWDERYIYGSMNGKFSRYQTYIISWTLTYPIIGTRKTIFFNIAIVRGELCYVPRRVGKLYKNNLVASFAKKGSAPKKWR